MEWAVEVEDMTVAYDERPVLWDVDMQIPKGSLAAIVGPNGAGKSTLIKAILGLLTKISGSVKFYLDGRLAVLDVVLMGRYGHLGWFKRPGAAEREMAMDVLRKTGMEAYVDRQISRLSGGQQQRVFLARALIQEADIYFMDEPFKGVDAKTEKAIVALLQEMKSRGKTVIVVHHDLATVAEYFDWVTMINLRRIAMGPVEEVFTSEHIEAAYNARNPLRREGPHAVAAE